MDCGIFCECGSKSEQTVAYSPVTYGHLCYYVNGMLSMPGATTGLINVFDVDPDTMRYDTAAFAADVAEYGLFTYEEFSLLCPVPEIIFNAFIGQYLKIALGKGLITEENLASLIDRYAAFFETDEDTDETEKVEDIGHRGNDGRGHGNNNRHGRGNGSNRR